MCDSCLAHREWRDAVDRMITKLPRVEQRDEKIEEKLLELWNEMPMSLPDGTGFFSPIQILRWMKKQLGYPG